MTHDQQTKIWRQSIPPDCNIVGLPFSHKPLIEVQHGPNIQVWNVLILMVTYPLEI